MILVTGATGLLGQAVCRALRKEGVRIHAVGGPDTRDTLFEAFSSGDLCDRAFVESLFHPYDPKNAITGVIHCAAKISGVAGQKADPSLAVTDNLCMTARLLEATAKAGISGRFVFVSSSTVYPALHGNMHEDSIQPYLREDSRGGFEIIKPLPDPHYEGVGGMKLYCEQLCRFYKNKFGLKHTILRPTAIYGVGDTSSHVIPDLLRRALAGENPLKVWGSPDVVRDFVHVSDVAEACALAAQGAGAAGPWNIGSGESTTMAGLATSILRACGREGDKVVFVDGPQAIPYRQVSIEKAKRELCWAPRVSLEIGLRQTVEWVRARM